MKENNIIRVKRSEGGRLEQVLPTGGVGPLPSGKTDWKRLASMTDTDALANAMADPDNPPLDAEQLSRFRSVPIPKDIRNRLNLTQEQFSDKFGIPLGTLRDWEQHLHEPDAAARSYLRVIDKHPEVVIESLAG